MQNEYCKSCRQPLEEYEAGFCEGCGMANAMQEIKNAMPGRKFGRVSDADWQEIRNAVDASGLSLVAWALPMMLSKARREKSKGRKPVADRGEK